MPLRRRPRILAALAVTAVAVSLVAMQRPLRRHTATEARPLYLVPADADPPAESRVEIEPKSNRRTVRANSIPAHRVGRFPNHGNPHAIRQQRLYLRLPLEPEVADEPTPLHNPTGRGRPGRPFGVAVNGVLFEPGAAEFWRGERRAGWTYEPLGGAVPLGLDANHAHVQPGGKYHYHGLPTGLLERLGWSEDKHSPLIGWAADGFPVYALTGYADPDDPGSPITELTSSYRLKEGPRPAGVRGPGGAHDGTFVQDYAYTADAGTLDQCNGRQCVTPEFSEGTYAYFLTRDWPVIPRWFRGKPVELR